MSDVAEAAPCRLGYVEHDGFQFCHEHCGWHHYTDRTMNCDLADNGSSPYVAAPERRTEAQRAEGK